MKKLIGMIHLLPLTQYNDDKGIDLCIQKAIKELKILEEAGFDGALLENYNDYPEAEFVSDLQIVAMSVIAQEIKKHANIALGAQLLLNDYEASLAICRAVGLQFTRLDVFVDNVTGRWGDIYPQTERIMQYKKQYAPYVKLYTDIQVKHKVMLDSRKTLLQSAQEAIQAGTDGLVITGTATGVETNIADLKAVKEFVPHLPVIIGSGLNADNFIEQMSIADMAIVGTGIKTDDCVDFNKASYLVELKNRLNNL